MGHNGFEIRKPYSDITCMILGRFPILTLDFVIITFVLKTTLHWFIKVTVEVSSTVSYTE